MVINKQELFFSCSNKFLHEPIWRVYSNLPGQRFSCRSDILSAMGWTQAKKFGNL